MAIRLRQGSLNLTPDTRDCLDGSSLELGHFQARVKHVLDESRVLKDLVRGTSELELLYNLGRLVNAKNRSRCCDAEPWVGRVKALETGKARLGGDKRAEKCRLAMHVLCDEYPWSVAGLR